MVHYCLNVDILETAQHGEQTAVSSQSCFGCGDDNSSGLRLRDICLVDDVVRAILHPREEHQGFLDSLHGGVAATALDEIMGYACRLIGGSWAVTAKMDLRYRRRLTLTSAITVEAGMVDCASRRYRVWGRLIDSKGAIAVEAEAIFIPIVVPQEHSMYVV